MPHLLRVALAEPIEFSEISLLVRARESDPSIIRGGDRAQAVRPLTPQQETALNAQGATDSLIQALRRSTVVLAQADATAFESRRERARSGVGWISRVRVIVPGDGHLGDLPAFAPGSERRPIGVRRAPGWARDRARLHPVFHRSRLRAVSQAEVEIQWRF